MKLVKYLTTYEVEDWVRYIAQDGDGRMWGYDLKPEWNPKFEEYETQKGGTEVLIHTPYAIPPLVTVEE